MKKYFWLVIVTICLLASVAHSDLYSVIPFVLPGTSGNVLTSDGSNWTSASPAGGGTWGSITGTLSNQTDLQTALNGKQASLGFTAENVANKSTNTSLGTSDTLYPTQNAVKTYADTKQSALGFTAENVANKSTDGTFASNSDTLYPSQKASKTYADTGLALKEAIYPASNRLAITVSRTDSYTADGSDLKPFKTFAAAQASAISRGLTTVQFDYIDRGTTTENVVLNGSGFTDVLITGHEAVEINPASGLAFDVSTNNASLDFFRVRGLTFRKPIQMIGSVNNGAVGADEMSFEDCNFFGLVTGKNLVQLFFHNSVNNSDYLFENIEIATISGGDGHAPGSALTVVSNNAHNAPNGWSSTVVICEKTICGADATVDAGSLLQYREGARVGYPGGTITCNGTCQAYSNYFRSAVAGTGSLSNRGSVYNSTIASSLTFTEDGYHPKLRVNNASDSTNSVVIYKDGHVKSTQTTAPTATPNANAGTGATCTISNATDSAGTISLTTTGVLSNSGAECDLTFNKAYSVAPICTFSPSNSTAVLDSVIQGVYFTTATTKATINFANTDAVGRNYQYSYQCIETQ